MEVVKLSELEIGERGKVIKINGKGEINRRIRDMGIVSGTFVEVETKATLGDPIEIKATNVVRFKPSQKLKDKI